MKRVTSIRQRDANRANAEKSTGPRSLPGKQASRKNARRHGLATSIHTEPGANAEISRLADAIVGDVGRPDLRIYAERIAEAEIDLRRIRHARERWRVAPPVRYRTKVVWSDNSMLLSKAACRLMRRKEYTFEMIAPAAIAMGWSPILPLYVDKRIGKPLKDQTERILDRYESRALSRRKFAIRQFDAAHVPLGGGKG